MNKLYKEIIFLIENFRIEELCENFFHKDFKWVVKGTSCLSKVYNSLDDYYKHVLDRMKQELKPGACIKLKHFYICENTLICELEGRMESVKGIKYNNQYCWIIKFDKNLIVSITAYLDTLLVNKLLPD
jgi:uncharacterized protein